MNCATGKGVTVKAKDKRYPTRAIRKLDGKTTSETRISSSETINPLVTKKGWVTPLETKPFKAACPSNSSTPYVLQSNLVQNVNILKE